MSEIEGPVKTRLEFLLKKYDELDQKAATANDNKADYESARDNVKTLLKDEIVNMGLGARTKLSVPGVGDFSFTTERYYRLPANDREEFALLLIRRSLQHAFGPGDEAASKVEEIIAALHGTEVALFTINKGDLNAWCKERIDEAEEDEEPLPSYITYFEDKFVPRISLASAKARRQEKAAQKAAQRQQKT